MGTAGGGNLLPKHDLLPQVYQRHSPRAHTRLFARDLRCAVDVLNVEHPTLGGAGAAHGCCLPCVVMTSELRVLSDPRTPRGGSHSVLLTSALLPSFLLSVSLSLFLSRSFFFFFLERPAPHSDVQEEPVLAAATDGLSEAELTKQHRSSSCVLFRVTGPPSLSSHGSCVHTYYLFKSKWFIVCVYRCL